VCEPTGLITLRLTLQVNGTGCSTRARGMRPRPLHRLYGTTHTPTWGFSSLLLLLLRALVYYLRAHNFMPCSKRYLSLLHLAVARARCRPVCTRLLRALGGTPCLDRAASLLPLQAYSLNACACNHLQPCLLCGVYPCVHMLG
jgi:hypothetical protein